MNNDFISESNKPKKPLTPHTINNNDFISKGLTSNVTFQKANIVEFPNTRIETQKEIDDYSNLVQKSTSGTPSYNVIKNQKVTSNTKKWIAILLATTIVTSCLITYKKKTGITWDSSAIVHLMDSSKMFELADQVCERYNIIPHHTDDHMHIWYDYSDIADTIKQKDGKITPTAIALTYLAMGDQNSIQIIASHADNEDKDEINQMLNTISNKYDWRNYRHNELYEKYKEITKTSADDAIGTLIQDQIKKSSFRGGK